MGDLMYLRNKKISKLVVAFIAISFTFSYIPVSVASEPVANETGVPVPTVPVKSATAPSTTIPQDPTSAFLTEEPLSVPINPEPLPIEPVPCDGCELPIPPAPPTPEEQFAQAAKEMVISDLINSFGFKKEDLENLIKNGLIKFEADYKNLKLTVFIDPSVKLPDGAVNLTDLLGSDKLPGQINYQLGLSPIQPAGACYMDSTGSSYCPPASYQLEHGSFRIGERFVDLDYLGLPEDPNYDCAGGKCVSILVGDNRLHSVKIYDVDDPCGDTPGCLAPVTMKLIKEIRYDYMEAVGVCNSDGTCYPSETIIVGHIKYYDGKQGLIASRDVNLKKMEDGQYHIQTVTDYDKDGKMLANSKFNYTVLHTGGGRGPIGIGVSVALDHITRTDADGKLLSTIKDIHPAITIQIIGREPLYQATVKLPSGKKVDVIFSTFEDLLRKVLKIERSNVIQKELELLQNDKIVIVSDSEQRTGDIGIQKLVLPDASKLMPLSDKTSGSIPSLPEPPAPELKSISLPDPPKALELEPLPEPGNIPIPDAPKDTSNIMTSTVSAVPAQKPEEQTPEEILSDLEVVVRENGATVFLDPADSPKFDFDLNGDGKVNATDQIIIRNRSYTVEQLNKFLTAIGNRLGLREGNEKFHSGLDVNGNGVIDGQDYQLIRKVLMEAAGLVESVPHAIQKTLPPPFRGSPNTSSRFMPSRTKQYYDPANISKRYIAERIKKKRKFVEADET